MRKINEQKNRKYGIQLPPHSFVALHLSLSFILSTSLSLSLSLPIYRKLLLYPRNTDSNIPTKSITLFLSFLPLRFVSFCVFFFFTFYLDHVTLLLRRRGLVYKCRTKFRTLKWMKEWILFPFSKVLTTLINIRLYKTEQIGPEMLIRIYIYLQSKHNFIT